MIGRAVTAAPTEPVAGRRACTRAVTRGARGAPRAARVRESAAAYTERRCPTAEVCACRSRPSSRPSNAKPHWRRPRPAAQRAEVKEQLKPGSLSLEQLFEEGDDDETLAKLKVVSVLESMPGVGKVRARRLMEELDISESRRLRGLGATSARSCSSTPDPRSA